MKTFKITFTVLVALAWATLQVMAYYTDSTPVQVWSFIALIPFTGFVVIIWLLCEKRPK